MKIKYLIVFTVLIIAVLCSASFAKAQTADNSVLIAKLEAEIQSLVQQIAAIQAQQSTTATATPIKTNTVSTPTSTIALGSCNIDFTENNGNDNYDVDEYLGPNIYPLESSDWMHDSDIINEVNTLTSGISDNMDKAIAIANWIHTSRPYDTASVANSTLTPANALQGVEDIYNESTGVCLDSAIITVAMFRLAGIPSRLVQPAFEIHAQAQAYINNKWITFDDTFGTGTAEWDITDFPPTVFAYSGELSNPSVYKPIPVQSGESLETEAYRQFSTADDDSVFGKVTLANIPTNTNLYPADSLFNNAFGMLYPVRINITRTDDKNLYYSACNGQFSYVFSSSQPPDLNCGQNGETVTNPYTEIPATTANGILPIIESFDKTPQGNTLLRENETSRYLETVKLPLGQYNITYYTITGTQSNIASANFDVVQGNTVQLTADKFSMVSGANSEYYNDVVKRINDTWTTCANNPPPTTCTPNWQCSGFGSCVNDQQTQTCNDANSCGVITGEPTLLQSCTMTTPITATLTCPSGMTWNTSSHACTESIQLCLAGTFNSIYNLCVTGPICPASTNFINQSGTCSDGSTPTCPSGMTWNTSSHICSESVQQCPVGTFNSSLNLCVTGPTCSSGTSFDNQSGECLSGSTSFNLSQSSLASISGALRTNSLGNPEFVWTLIK